MNTVMARPALYELQDFIAKVESYPVSAGQLIDLARRLRAPQPVIDFYRSFGRNQLFDNQEDLLSRSEQVDIMRQEEQDMPKDDLNVPEED